jgi:thiamine biosynthesis lipoprotein
MTPLIGASLERLGYDADYSLRPAGTALPAPAWDTVLDWTGTAITAHAPVVLDIGAAGKGLLVDLLAAELEADGVDSYVIDASGDLLAHAAGPMQVGLEHPYNPEQAIGIVQLDGRSLCASAANRRAWGDGLHHVLDARTGEPVRTVAATWAIAQSGVGRSGAMCADAIATALFFDGGPELAHTWGVSWVRMLTDGRVEYSPDSAVELFTRASVDS